MARIKYHQYADKRIHEYLRRHYNITDDVRGWNIDRAADSMIILRIELYVHEDFMATEEELIAKSVTERSMETESGNSE